MKSVHSKAAWACAWALLCGALPAAALETGTYSAEPMEAPANAQGSIGDSVADPEVGLAVPISALDLSAIGAGNQVPGEPGLAIGARYMYQATQRLSVGAELDHQNYGDKDFVMPDLAGAIGGSMLTVQGLARYWLSAPRTVNPYAIGGLGFNDFAVHVRETADPGNVLLDTDSMGLAVSAGGGVEGRFGKDRSFVAGAEMRWMLATIDSGKFGASTVNALGLGGRVGYKF